jgi:phosphatidylserine/phosphatidylglycerophosphate/cardiolipin synthase-like enzyme
MTTLAFAIVDPHAQPREPVLAGVRVYYGPSPETAEADVTALATARKSIDMAAFVLTDRAVIGALSDAARRGAKVRIYLDRDEMAHSSARTAGDLAALASAQGVAIRYKAARTEAMHLKAYAIDNRLLRTGSANFSFSGERY